MNSYCAWCGNSLEERPVVRFWMTWRKRTADACFVLLTGSRPPVKDTHGICLRCMKRHEPELYRQYVQFEEAGWREVFGALSPHVAPKKMLQNKPWAKKINR